MATDPQKKLPADNDLEIAQEDTHSRKMEQHGHLEKLREACKWTSRVNFHIRTLDGRMND